MIVNKLWTLIYNNWEDSVSTFGLVSSNIRIRVNTKFYKFYIDNVFFIHFFLSFFSNYVCPIYVSFFKKLLDTCPFLGLLIPLFQTSGDISHGFQSQSGQPYSHLVEAYMIYVP